jgi:hypothetical protein
MRRTLIAALTGGALLTLGGCAPVPPMQHAATPLAAAEADRRAAAAPMTPEDSPAPPAPTSSSCIDRSIDECMQRLAGPFSIRARKIETAANKLLAVDVSTVLI